MLRGTSSPSSSSPFSRNKNYNEREEEERGREGEKKNVLGKSCMWLPIRVFAAPKESCNISPPASHYLIKVRGWDAGNGRPRDKLGGPRSALTKKFYKCLHERERWVTLPETPPFLISPPPHLTPTHTPPSNLNGIQKDIQKAIIDSIILSKLIYCFLCLLGLI